MLNMWGLLGKNLCGMQIGFHLQLLFRRKGCLERRDVALWTRPVHRARRLTFRARTGTAFQQSKQCL